MTDAPATPDHKTFDLFDALTGISYPEDTVEVFFSEDLMYRINKTEKKIDELLLRGDTEQADALDAKLDELRKAAESVKYVFTIRSTPRELTRDIFNAVQEEFPDTQDFIGRKIENPARGEEFSIRHWALHIVKIVNPEGAVLGPIDEAMARALRGKLPTPAQERIAKAIDDMYNGAKAGYESLIKDEDFLSDASPEA